MKKKISLSLSVAITLIAMTVTFSITMIVAMQLFDRTVTAVKAKETMYNKIAEIDQVARENYYADIDDQTLNDMISTGYIAGLNDKNSRYYTVKQMSELTDLHAGKLIGIGIEVIKDSTGYAKVVKVYVGSPAEEAGIEKGSYITQIDGADLKTATLENIRSLLQGEAGTSVKLLNVLGSDEEELELTRKTYETPTVETSMQGETGYVKISTFNEKTPAEFDYGVRQLIEQGATSLVFDLRGNSSTMLEQAARALDVLCPSGTLFSATYKDGTNEALYTSDDSEITLPMVVLTNGETASAGEMFAAVLRDYGKAKLVGERTAGKGTLQQLYRLTDGSGLEVTVATLLPPSSTAFDQVGLAPDYESSLSAEQMQNFYDLTFSSDTQIQRALEVADALAKNQQVAEAREAAASQSASTDESSSEEGSSSDSASDSEGE